MKLLRIVFFSLILIRSVASTEVSPLPIDQPVRQYIQDVHQQYQFDTGYLNKIFQNTHYDPNVIADMEHPHEKNPWYRYRQLFITQKRIDQGVEFWRQHRKTFDEAEQKYGVPPSIILAILGVETSYGRIQGNYPVLDTLATLAFHYPKRAKFFKTELTEYLLLTREQHLSPFKPTGSYAGAIGMPQFMPSTYRKYAVDYSNQGSANLNDSAEDAIFSVANYLRSLGWRPNQPVAERLAIQRVAKRFVSDSATPRRTLGYFRNNGIKLNKNHDTKLKSAIVELPIDTEAKLEHWLTFGNFKVIMWYNPRINYAMAVYQLNEAIKDEYRRTNLAASTKSPSARRSAAGARVVPATASARPEQSSSYSTHLSPTQPERRLG